MGVDGRIPPLISPQNGLRDEVLKKLRVFGSALTEQYGASDFSETRLILARLFVAFGQVPGIDRLVAIERHGDHPSALNSTSGRYESPRSRIEISGLLRAAIKELLHHDGLSAACLAITACSRRSSRDRRRERNELTVGSLKQEQW